MSKRKYCKTKGCKNELPDLAARDGDPYCSANCCRSDLGLSLINSSGALIGDEPMKGGAPNQGKAKPLKGKRRAA